MLGRTILGYKVDELIGAGGFGSVYKVSKSNIAGTEIRALKHISIPTQKQYLEVLNSMGGDYQKADDYFAGILQNVISEIQIIRNMSAKRSANIVAYFENDIVQHTSPRTYDIYILMEYLTPLTSYIHNTPLTVGNIIDLAKDMLNALTACHSNNIIHRDIKEDNIFVSGDGVYKLGDFGISRVVSSKSGAASMKGTPNYIAPEVYLGKEKYDNTVDLYSLGIVLYRLLNGNRGPFLPSYPDVYTSEDEDSAFEKRMRGMIPSLPLYAQNELGEVIVRALMPRDKRYSSAQEFLDAILSAEHSLSNAELNRSISQIRATQNTAWPKANPAGMQSKTFVVDTVPPMTKTDKEYTSNPFETISAPYEKNKTDELPSQAEKHDTPKEVASNSESPSKSLSYRKYAIMILGFVLVVAILLSLFGKYLDARNTPRPTATPQPTTTPQPTATPAPTLIDKEYTSGDYKYKLYSNGEAVITDYTGTESELRIPSLVDGAVVTEIGKNAFHNCDSLTNVVIPEGVTSIGHSAFNWCGSLTSITIPDSVTSIGDNPFDKCSKLTNINVSPDHPTLAIIDGVLFEKNEKRLVCYPCAFTEKSYTVPNGIRVIGDIAFSHCYSLTSITLPDSVTSIGDDAFNSCDSLTNITLPDSVTSIGKDAFWYCKSLTSITLPDSVTNIGNGAFDYCKSLTSITLPDGVTSIGNNPFSLCEKLTNINVSPNNPTFAIIDGVLFEKNEKRLVCYPRAFTAKSYTVPNGIRIIGDSAFSYCDSLISITLPDSVTSIGDSAFSYCESLTSVTLPDSVTSIGDDAFWYCESLTSITLPDSVTSIVTDTFGYCESLTSITIPDGVTDIAYRAFIGCKSLRNISVAKTNMNYVVTNGLLIDKRIQEVIAFAPASTGKDLIIPEGVLRLGEYALAECDFLESVVCPDGLISIGDRAISYCRSLLNVTLPSSVTSIGEAAFAYRIVDGVDHLYGDLLITCPRDSYAWQYAVDNNIPVSDKSRVFELNSNISMDKGRATVSWTDTADNSPYEVLYMYVGEDGVAHPNYWAGGDRSSSTTYAKSFTIGKLVPGRTYKIEVRDCNGRTISKNYTIPAARTFVDGKLQASSIKKVTIQPRVKSCGASDDSASSINSLRASDIISNKDDKEYGFRYEISYPQLAYARTYFTQVVVIAPNGYTECEVADTVDYGREYAGLRWDMLGYWTFKKMYEYNSNIPSGTWAVELYWDGMFVNRSTFTVQ